MMLLRCIITNSTLHYRTYDSNNAPSTHHLDSMLLNGNHITMIVPGDKDDEDEKE